MATKKSISVSAKALANARRRAAETRQQLAGKSAPSDLLTAPELADGAPFYLVLRNYVQQLKAAREVAGLTLADVADRSGLAVESLSRLETGALTNPTWKTLGAYAVAVGRRPYLIAEAIRANGRRNGNGGS